MIPTPARTQLLARHFTGVWEANCSGVRSAVFWMPWGVTSSAQARTRAMGNPKMRRNHDVGVSRHPVEEATRSCRHPQHPNSHQRVDHRNPSDLPPLQLSQEQRELGCHVHGSSERRLPGRPPGAWVNRCVNVSGGFLPLMV